MSILAAVAASVLSSFLSSMLVEGSKYYISGIWSADKNLNELTVILNRDLRELRKTLKKIDVCLSNSRLPSDWLDELEECRYEIEDIEDSMVSACKKEIVTKFLRANIKYVAMMRTRLETKEEEMEARLSNRQTNLEQASLGHDCLADELFIRGKEKTKIVEELIAKDSFGVSIIGIGGIGKTKLAQAIADEASIQTYFPCIIFPPRSSNFNLKIVLDYVKGKLPSKDQRVLFVYDALHSVAPEDWRQFWSKCQKILNPESKVLITTQNPRVASVTGTSKHCLHPLSENECFSLIQNLAKANKNLCEADVYAITHNMKDLVDTCKGLPLLANQIGLLLSAAEPGHRLDTIIEITRRSSWKVPDLERVLLNLKPVSLLVQRPHLKRCLAYCSLFPPDYEFKEDNLVQFWMAEGFNQLSRDVSFLEQATREYFDDLHSCSLFESSEFLPGEKPSYKMPGLAHDLAQNVASKTFCRKHIGTSVPTLLHTEISNITRHFSLSCENSGADVEIVIDHLLRDIQKMCSGLRTFLLIHDVGKKITKNPTFFHSLSCLRVLDLSHTNLTKLESKNISGLKYLCYLDLSNTPVETLPKLSKNPELQVLKLNYCDNLRELPKDLTTLTRLISLQVNTRGLGSMPLGIGKLINLQRLDIFIVGKRKGFKIVELKSLNDLRKSLRITKLENVESKLEAQEAKLHSKVKLERLELEWSSSVLDESSKQVLEGLEPPKNLKELTIRNYPNAEFPEWLSRTEVCGLLELMHLDHCKAIPSIHQLAMLKTLRVEAMHEITQMSHDLFGKSGQPRALPYTVTLVLCDMPQLNRWIEFAAGYMPRLCNLHVEKCPSILQLPELDRLTSLEELQISRCMVLEELPTLPTSLTSLIIKHSGILKQRCQVGEADWPKIRDINHVEIDSEPVDTSQQNPATPSNIQGSHTPSSRRFGFSWWKGCFSSRSGRYS